MYICKYVPGVHATYLCYDAVCFSKQVNAQQSVTSNDHQSHREYLQAPATSFHIARTLTIKQPKLLKHGETTPYRTHCICSSGLLLFL
eukprot:m.329436 g.329436  ORF g.329436 m.329436 type:complete len:88 (+) comp16037_c0_seq1:940-1203(+)